MRGLMFCNLCLCLLIYIVPAYALNDDQFYLHHVQYGETLSCLAPSEQWLLIKKVNRIDERHLPTGMMILLPRNATLSLANMPAPVSLYEHDVAHLDRSIVVYIDIQYFGAYEKGVLFFWGPISSGIVGRYDTPRGHFNVLWKARSYRSKKYDASMPYAVNYSRDGYFLHEQSLPGKPASHGCVRLLREDAQRIFVWIQKNDQIIIK